MSYTNVVFLNLAVPFFLCSFKFCVTKTINVKKIWTFRILYRIPTKKKPMSKTKKNRIWVWNLLFAKIIQIIARKNFVTKLIPVALIVPKNQVLHHLLVALTIKKNSITKLLSGFHLLLIWELTKKVPPVPHVKNKNCKWQTCLKIAAKLLRPRLLSPRPRPRLQLLYVLNHLQILRAFLMHHFIQCNFLIVCPRVV